MEKTKCACGGRLEQIARTKSQFMVEDGLNIRQTFYSSCDRCERIYKRHKLSTGMTGYAEYKGKLTWDEIMYHAPKCVEDITKLDEARIIARRQ